MNTKVLMDYIHQGLNFKEAVEAATLEQRYKDEYAKHPENIKPKKGVSYSKNSNICLVRYPFSCTDHLGKVYRCKSEMCKAYHVSPSAYDSRIRKGYSLERALTGK